MSNEKKELGGLIRRKGTGERPSLPVAPAPAPVAEPVAAKIDRTKVTVFLDPETYQAMRRMCFDSGLSHQEFLAAAVRRAVAEAARSGDAAAFVAATK